MAGDELGRFQHPVRRPAVTMEHADPVAEDAARGMHPDLSGQVPGETHIVVSEHDLHSETLGEKAGEEGEDDRSQRRRRPHDRVLDVARDEQRFRVVRVQEAYEPVDHQVGGPLGWSPRSVATTPQTEVKVRDQQRRALSGGRTLNE